MILNEQEKKDLEEMKNSRGWQILEKIEKEARQLLWEELMKFNTTNQDDLDKIQKYQIYAEARQDFFKNTENHLKRIYAKD